MKQTLLEYCQEYYNLTRGNKRTKFTSVEQFKLEIGDLEASEVINEFKTKQP